jgi:predicted O-methyltransferase YrrM
MYQYTRDWFSEHAPAWERLLRTPKQNALEIGSHEGRAACWLLQNVLTTDGVLVCLDPWVEEDYLGNPMNGVYERFINNTELARAGTQAVIPLRRHSVDGLAELLVKGNRNRFEFIYIDGAHRAVDTLTDACMAFQLLAPDGIMVFDDYFLGAVEGTTVDKKNAVDAFVKCFKDFCSVVMNNKQVGVKKRCST